MSTLWRVLRRALRFWWMDFRMNPLTAVWILPVPLFVVVAIIEMEAGYLLFAFVCACIWGLGILMEQIGRRRKDWFWEYRDDDRDHHL